MRPTATTSTATPPGSPSPAPAPAAGLSSPPNPKSSAGIKRHRKSAPAAPLSDVTNLLLLPETPTPIKPTTTRAGLRVRPLRQPLPTPSSAASASSTCSSSASASVTPTPAPRPPSSAVLEEERSTVVKSAVVVVRRGSSVEAQGGRSSSRRNPTTRSTSTAASNKGKGKGKAPVAAAAGTASCPPLGRSARTNSRKNSMAQDTRPISSSAPCHGAKKKRPPPSTPKLPEDFVKKQRAYFADVDAFELPEEEVSESELE